MRTTLCWLAMLLLLTVGCETETPTPSQTPTPSRTPTITPTPEPATVEIRKFPLPVSGTVEMVYIPEGAFTMGSDDGDSDEQPVHQVYLDAFWIDRTEVTNAHFAAFIETTGYETTAEEEEGGWTYSESGWGWTEEADWEHPYGPESNLSGLSEHPVVQVSWYDANAFCEWRGTRLPSEAEWEKAAWGTDSRTYPWGDEFDCSRGNFDDETTLDSYTVPGGANCDGYDRTAPAGAFTSGASPYNALNMSGNVWEWVADWYDADYYDSSSGSNPAGPESGSSRVLRGGSWFSFDYNARSALRSRINPEHADDDIGLRCASTPS